MRVAVLGAGAWGTALGMILTRNAHEVVLWAHRPGYLREIKEKKANEQYLPGIPLPEEWAFEEKIQNAVARADAVIVAVPSKAFRAIAQNLAEYAGTIVSGTN